MSGYPGKLLHILREVRQVHVAFACQRIVHGEGGSEAVAGMSARTQLQVIPQQLLVVGMCAVFDDGLCTLHGALATKVGNTLLRNDDIDIVLRGILVGDERNDAGDESSLSH